MTPFGRQRLFDGSAPLAVLVALGIALRLAALLADRDLWIDEAMLALNLLGRDPAGLLEPLDHNQAAPAGFLLLSKLAVVCCGPGEWPLRLVACLGSIVGLVLFAGLGTRVLPPPAARLAVGLFAVSPGLVSYAAECKQYGTDAAVAVGLLLAAWPVLAGGGGARRWIGLTAAGVGAVWLSHPAAFVLGGVGCGTLFDAAVRRDCRRAAAAGLTALGWLSSFAGSYAVSLRSVGANDYLQAYWAGHFLPLPPAGVGEVGWVADHVFDFFQHPGGFGGAVVPAGGLAAVCCLVGAWEWTKRNRAAVVALTLPAALALLASGLKLYPFAGRMLLFLVPAATLLVAAGAACLAASLRPAAGAAVVGVLALAPVAETVHELRHPSRWEQITPVLDHVATNWRPGDRVYVYPGAGPAFAVYGPGYGFFPAAVVGGDHRDDPTGYRDELEQLPRGGRLWAVFSHRHKDEAAVIRAYLDGLGECVGAVRQPGAAGYCYRMD